MFRVLHTVSTLEASSGGPARTVSRLCDELSVRGADVSLVAQKRFPFKEKTVKPNRNSVRTVDVIGFGWEGTRIFYSPWYGSRLSRICRDGSIDLLHDHGIWLPANHASASVAGKMRIPRIVSPRGMLTPWALSQKALKKRLAWSLYQKNDLFSATALCATSMDEYHGIRKLGLKQPVAIIPNGVDLPPNLEGSPFSSPYRMALFLSRLHPKKGLPSLIDAWSRVRPDGWKLVIAGPDEGGHLKGVLNDIERLKLNDLVKIVGPVDDVEKWKLLTLAELFILPTFSENFGVVIAEALAACTPVITTKGAPWEELDSEGCGWWIEIGIDPLADAIRRAVYLPKGTLLEMGRRGRKFVVRAFNWTDIGEKMTDFYHWVLNGGSLPEHVKDR